MTVHNENCQQTRSRRVLLILIKGIYKISKVNIILNGKVLNDFFQSKDVHSIFIQKVLEVLAYATGKGKKCRD